MLELIEICRHKKILYMYDNIDDLIEGALDTKLLSINSIKSQRLDKQAQEVKNVEEQPAERRNHAEKSLQNFRVIHKNSISLNTSQISSVHADTPILSTKEPENSLSMGYKHLSITPETEVTESNAKNLLPISSECEVTLEDKRECDELVCKNPSTIDVCDNPSEILFDSNEDISQVQDVVLREKLTSINHLIANIKSLKDNPTPVCVFNSSNSIPILEESDNSLSGGGAGANMGEGGDSIGGSGGEGICGGENQGDNGDAGGVDIARSLITFESVHAGIGTGAGIEILAVVRYAGCGGGDNQQDPPQGPRRHHPLDASQNQTL
nr:hypothetical protein [Tanacetum cinerariifolium]